MPKAPPAPAKRKKLIVLLLAGLVAAAAAALFLVKDFDLLGLLNRGIELLAKIGPWPYFAAWGLLPAVGAPTLLFTLPAGRAFADRMGMGGVVLAAVVAMTFNMVLSYWLARWAMRPWLRRLLTRLGYKLPEVSGGDAMDLMIVLRMTPGVPFCVQNYLLGLAEAPFGKYFLVSSICSVPQTVLYTIFGDALLSGKAKLVAGMVALIVVLSAATHFVRRHYGAKRAAA